MDKTSNDLTEKQTSFETISEINKMIDSLNANSFNNSSEEIFDSHFVKSDLNIFLLLINKFIELKENSYKRNKLLSLITNYIYNNNNILKSLLLKTCELSSNELQIIGPKLQTILVTLPEIVFNNMKSINCEKFNRNIYFTRITEIIYLCVVEVYNSINAGIDSSLEFLSQLMGRIAFIGYSLILWNQLLIKLINNCENDFIWRRITYRLIVLTQNELYLEPMIKIIFSYSSNYMTIVSIIGKSVETNQKIKFLVVNKFLLINQFNSDLILSNIFGYLSSNSLDLFFEAFKNLLNAWSNSSAIKYRSHSQHLYISRALMIAAQYMKSLDFIRVKDMFTKLTMNGIEVHLKCSQIEIRNIGLTVGQNLLNLLSPDSKGIAFDIEENEEMKHLNDLFSNNSNNISNSNNSNNNNNNNNKIDIKRSDEQKTEENSNKTQIVLEKTDKTNNTDLDSDDDDLIPYDMSNDTPIGEAKKPIYLRDCMQGLIDYENPEWMRACLLNAEQVIRANDDSVGDVSLEFTQILLNLEDNCAVPDFIALRLRAMIALCVCSPKTVSQYLSSQFYEQNHTIRHRLDVLEVLLSASEELSTNIRKTNKADAREPTSATNEVKVAETHWSQVVKNRTDGKTRMIAHKTKSEKSFVNRFAQFAGHFFFPLMKNISGNEIKFDLLEEDHYVLGRLLYTLGIIIKNVSLTPIARQMGKELIEFIFTFRYHSELFIREAIIFDFCMIIISVPPIHLMNDMSIQLMEFQIWLKDITEREANSRCVQKAFTALSLLKEMAKEMPL